MFEYGCGRKESTNSFKNNNNNDKSIHPTPVQPAPQKIHTISTACVEILERMNWLQ